MPEVTVRKKFTAVEEIFHEGGPVASLPLRRAVALAVIHNPYAGKYVKAEGELFNRGGSHAIAIAKISVVPKPRK